jgi:hypothetical protein
MESSIVVVVPILLEMIVVPLPIVVDRASNQSSVSPMLNDVIAFDVWKEHDIERQYTDDQTQVGDSMHPQTNQ